MTEDKILPSSIEHLHGPEEVPYGEDELVVVCLVRDGRPYVKSFVEHYRSLGVKHLFFLDNGSTDGTVEAIKNYDNTTILRSKLPYKGYRLAFKRFLLDRFGKKDRWCLYADIDELFDYPYSDIVGLDSFLGYLTQKSYTAVAAQMLDMFPEEPLSGREGNSEEEPLKERHRFYDISNITKASITERLSLRNNTLENDDIEFFSGGIRGAIFGARPHLTKHPLVFLDGGVKPMEGLSLDSDHWVANASVADITCVLLHYKFLDKHFHKQAVRAVQEENYWNNSADYKKYLEILDKNPALQLKQESARELKGVNDLVENGFLVVSEEYMMMVYQEEERKGAGEHTPLRGERGGEPEDEAALYRARAQAKAQSLRAQRLKRQLKELREQNHREVERLSRRLARFRKKNRNLTQQLQSIRASRSVRLLKKLGRIRARMLGRKQ